MAAQPRKGWERSRERRSDAPFKAGKHAGKIKYKLGCSEVISIFQYTESKQKL